MMYMFSLLVWTFFPHHLSFRVYFCCLIWKHAFLKQGTLAFEWTISPVCINVPLLFALQLGSYRTSGHLHHLCADTQHFASQAWMSCWASHRSLATAGKLYFHGEEMDLRSISNFWQLPREAHKWSKVVKGKGTGKNAQGPNQKEADL